MSLKHTLISVATAAVVVAGGSFAIAQTTGTQRPAAESASSGSSAAQGTGSGMGNNMGQGATGTTGTAGTTGQTDSMGRTGTQSARMDRN